MIEPKFIGENQLLYFDWNALEKSVVLFDEEKKTK